MKYRGSRGCCSGVSFEQSLFAGWLDDGGLLVPEHVPELSKDKLLSWSTHSYQEICMKMFDLFTDDDFLSTFDIKALFKAAYASFPDKVVPLKSISDHVHVLELFHGPTHSFKDIAMSTAAPLLNLVLKHNKKQGIVYVATSGDTGSSVIHATKDASNLEVITLFPGGQRITELQRLLMTTVDSKNIHNFSADCFCDEFDILFLDFPSKLSQKYPDLVATSLNSLTWIRVLMQACHVIYAYFQVAKNFEEISFVIPTGGGGHITSALVAKKLGLPIKLVAAFNDKNLNFCNLLTGNECLYNLAVKKSLTPAMDIQMPTQFDRLLYLLGDGNVELVNQYMQAFYNEGSMKVSGELLANVKQNISTFITNDNEIIETMKRCWDEHGYVIDPHTASGFAHMYKQEKCSTEKTVYMGCASPIKFKEELESANIPFPDTFTKYFDQLKSMKENVNELPVNKGDWMSFLIEYIEKNIS